MTEGPILLNVIKYTVPIILTSILQLLFNAADLVVVGRFCGSVSVGAVGATSSITNLLINLFMGVSVGVSVTVAQAMGAKDEESVSKLVHTAIPTALVSGALLTVIGILFCEKLLGLMGTPENVLPLSATYMRIYFSGMIFVLLYNFAAAILRAVGDTKGPLIYLSIAGVINVVLNVVFVVVFHMNVAGVALATIISQAVSAVLVVLALMKREDCVKLYLRKMKIYKEKIAHILRLGIPAGIQSSLFSISNVIIQSSVNSFGDLFVAGNAAAANIEGFVYVGMNAFQQATINFVGQNMGARKYDRVKRVFWICLGSVAAVGLALGVLVWGFGRELLSIYITDSEAAIAAGMIRLTYICLPYVLCGILEVVIGALRGIGSAMFPMVASILGVCGVRLMWIFTIFRMSAFHTPQVLFLSYTISWVFTFLVQLMGFLYIFKRKSDF